MTDHEGLPCPSCGDTMTVKHDNYLPTWSDHHDNIVCWWCAMWIPCSTWNNE
jgi:hypothetical protein